MAGTDQNDHNKVWTNSDLNPSTLVNFILPLTKTLALKLNFGLRAPHGEIAFADPLRRRRRDVVPAPNTDLTACSLEFIPIFLNMAVLCQDSVSSPGLGLTWLRTR